MLEGVAPEGLSAEEKDKRLSMKLDKGYNGIGREVVVQLSRGAGLLSMPSKIELLPEDWSPATIIPGRSTSHPQAWTLVIFSSCVGSCMRCGVAMAVGVERGLE